MLNSAAAGTSSMMGGGPSSFDQPRATTSSRDEASVSISNASDMETTEWIEQDEPGVCLTSLSLSLSLSKSLPLSIFQVLEVIHPGWPNVSKNGLATKVEKSRKQMKERKNRAKKIRGVKKTKAGDAAGKKK